MLATVSLIGIVREAQFSGSIQFEELRLLVINTLDLDPLWEVLEIDLPRTTIPLQILVRRMNSLSLYSNLPPTLSGRSLIQNCKLVSTAAYLLTSGRLTRDLIRQSATEFALLERTDPDKTFKLTPSNVKKVFRALNLAMSDKMIDLWVRETEGKRVFREKLTLSEFLFLVSNATSRYELLRKVLPYDRSVEPGKRTGLFSIDKSTRTSQNPNALIQSVLDNQFDQSRVILEGANNAMDFAKKRKRKIKDYLAIGHSFDGGLDEFKSLLRDKDLEQSTRAVVRENDARMRRRHTSLVAQAYEELRIAMKMERIQGGLVGRVAASHKISTRKSPK